MFLDAPDKTELRQGDVVYGLYFPLVKSEDIVVLGKPTIPLTVPGQETTLSPVIAAKGENKDAVLVQMYARQGYSIVLSQCCDLALREGGKMNSPAFVVAPLAEVPYLIRSNNEKLELLKQNRLEHFTSLFYLPFTSPLPSEMVVDFSRMASIDNKDYSHALAGKSLQMTDESRVTFKTKLASHFGRPTEEELKAHLFENYNPS
jgi:hypothetical protein